MDVNMNCDETDNGWFDIKASRMIRKMTWSPKLAKLLCVISWHQTLLIQFQAYMNGWEPDVTQNPCTGTAGGSAPNPTNNHVGFCGKVNVFEWGSGGCIVDNF